MAVQDKFNKPNVIYKITKDIDLKGGTLTIPEGCTLDFQGGNFSNGTIIGNNTEVLTSRTTILFNEVIISGTWVNKESYSSWFFNTKKRISFQNALDLTSDNVFTHVYLENGNFIFDFTNENYTNPALLLKYNNLYIHIPTTINIITNDSDYYCVINSVGKDNIVIDGEGLGCLLGDVETHTGSTGEWGHGINFIGGTNLIIKNITCNKFWGDGINLQGGTTPTTQCVNVTLDNVTCNYNRRQGLSIESADNCKVINSEFSYTGAIKKTSPGAGIDIEPYTINNVARHIIIDNCRAFATSFLIANTGFPEVRDITFKNCHTSEMLIAQSDIKVEGCIIDNYITFLAGKNVQIQNTTVNSEILFNNYSVMDTVIFDSVNVITTPDSPPYNNALLTKYGGTSEILNFNISNCNFIDSYDKKVAILIEATNGKMENTTIIGHQIDLYGFKEINSCTIKKSNSQVVDSIRFNVTKDLLISRCLLDSSKYIFNCVDNNKVFIQNSNLGSAQLTKYDLEFWLEFVNPSMVKFHKVCFDLPDDSACDVARASKQKGVDIETINGLPITVTKGSTDSRPILDRWANGYQYYDTTVELPIYWNGGKWVSMTGEAVAKHRGNTESRPSLSSEDFGFIYYDTTFGKLIVWSGTGWVDV